MTKNVSLLLLRIPLFSVSWTNALLTPTEHHSISITPYCLHCIKCKISRTPTPSWLNRDVLHLLKILSWNFTLTKIRTLSVNVFSTFSMIIALVYQRNEREVRVGFPGRQNDFPKSRSSLSKHYEQLVNLTWDGKLRAIAPLHAQSPVLNQPCGQRMKLILALRGGIFIAASVSLNILHD